jgi:hypothetical protein
MWSPVYIKICIQNMSQKIGNGLAILTILVIMFVQKYFFGLINKVIHTHRKQKYLGYYITDIV